MAAQVRIGDLVLAHYVMNGYGQIGKLRGVVVSIGDFKGTQTTSVYALTEGTSSSTMEIEPIAEAGSPEAQAAVRELLASGRRISEKAVAKLEATLA